ncbi:MAG: hypothetical protein AAF583_15615 [Pseudomonadota bacterium]
MKNTHKEMTSSLHAAIHAAIEASGRSGGDIAQSIGLARNYFSSARNGNSEPSFSTIAYLANELKIPIQYFAQYYIEGSERGERSGLDLHLSSELTFDQVRTVAEKIAAMAIDFEAEGPSLLPLAQLFALWHDAAGEFSLMRRAHQLCDVYEEPAANFERPRPLVIGKSSLTSAALGVGRPEELHRIYDQVGSDRSRRIAQDHDLVLREDRLIVSIEELSTQTIAGKSVSGKYLRALLPCRYSDGRQAVLTHCRLIH